MKAILNSATVLFSLFLVLFSSTSSLAEMIMIKMCDGNALKVPLSGIEEIYMASDTGKRFNGLLPPESELKENVREYYEECSWFLQGHSFANGGNRIKVHDVTVTGFTIGSGKVNVMIEAEVVGRQGYSSCRALGSHFTYGGELCFEQHSDGWRVVTPLPRRELKGNVVETRAF